MSRINAIYEARRGKKRVKRLSQCTEGNSGKGRRQPMFPSQPGHASSQWLPGLRDEAPRQRAHGFTLRSWGFSLVANLLFRGFTGTSAAWHLQKTPRPSVLFHESRLRTKSKCRYVGAIVIVQRVGVYLACNLPGFNTRHPIWSMEHSRSDS